MHACTHRGALFVMASSKGKVPVIHVVVCGLTSSSFQGLSGQGAGKSVLCNRFIRPNQDDLRLEHNSVLNLSEFGSNVINNTHFLYWGEKSAGMDDGQTVKFQVSGYIHTCTCSNGPQAVL